MNNQQAYNAWSQNYDTVVNKTRDLEAAALRETLSGFAFADALELGCGTGKNTVWLAARAVRLTAADFSEEMMAQAAAKISTGNVRFVRTDLREAWDFPAGAFDLVSCSLILEHIENLDFVFAEARRVLKTGGRFYLGELHPFRQYQGSKARFETGGGTFELECFVHHVSDYFAAGRENGFACRDLREWFDAGDRASAPRLLTIVFEKAG